MLYIIAITAFIAIFLMVSVLLYSVLTRRSVIVERLEKLATREQSTIRLDAKESRWENTFRRLGGALPVSPKDQSKYAQLLVAAGFRKESVYVFLGSKLVMACALPVLYMVYLSLYVLHGEPLQQTLLQFENLLILIVLAIVGFLLPSYWLYHVKNTRQMKMFHTLPNILDLITVCVEAGLSMDAALIRAAEAPEFRKDPLANEIRTAARETRAGKPRVEALKDMAERTMLEDVKAFVTMLAQTEKFGTSLSQALRVHADSLRTKRRQIAEEAAAKTTVKLLFPLIFFIFPALLVVILGPAFIRIQDFLK